MGRCETVADIRLTWNYAANEHPLQSSYKYELITSRDSYESLLSHPNLLPHPSGSD